MRTVHPAAAAQITAAVAVLAEKANSGPRFAAMTAAGTLPIFS